MTTPATAVRHDVPLAKVARRMIEHRWRVLPVLGDDGRVVGMVSRGDLLRADSPPPELPPPELPSE
jgi:CBS domain-containing protein